MLRFSVFLALFLSFPASVFANATGAVCLATLAHINLWADYPRGGQTPYGSFAGRYGNIYAFRSHDGADAYYCRVTGTRIEVSEARNFRELMAGMTHFYKREGDELTITTHYQVGDPDSTTFEMVEMLGRIEEMEGALRASRGSQTR